MIKRLDKIYKILIRFIFFVIPSLILFIIMITFFTSEFTSKKFPVDKYTFLLSVIGLTAGFSATCFQGASSTEDKKKKKYFFDAGERLMHSSLLFSYAIVLKFFYDNLDVYWIVGHINFPIKFFLFFIEGGLFFYGIMYVCFTLAILNRYLFKGHAEP